MCGIAGIVDFKRDMLNESGSLSAMLDAISHRGPDAAGTFMTHQAALGHRRLSVIDPYGGSQPMTRSLGGSSYTVVYNGELYNTAELRDELIRLGHSFLTYSDTEVLLLSYIEWGPSLTEKLNGIFAFAIWDDKKQRILLARDRMGVKPLFIARAGSSLLFGSEIKTILAHPNISASINGDGIRELFALAPARTAGKTLFTGIEELKPAECMIYSPLGTYVHRYWQFRSEPHEDSPGTTVEKVSHLIKDSAKRQLVSDVPICTFLSGGLDSSALSAIAAGELKKNGKQLLTFSIDYAGNDEHFQSSIFQPNQDSDFAGIMSEYIDSRHETFVYSSKALFSSLGEAVTARDLPGMADIDSSLLLFCRQIKNHATVALSGECADEFFGGYPWFYRDDLLNLDVFPWSNSLDLRSSVMSKQFTKLNISDYAKQRYFDTVEETPLSGEENQSQRKRRQMFYLNIKWFMANLLERKDRMSMAGGVEIRVPFCDHRLAQYVWNIPWGIKNMGGMEKGVLRSAVQNLLPNSIYNRKKSPYPKTHNPEYTRLVSAQLAKILADKKAPLHDLIDTKNVLDMLESNGIAVPWFGQLMKAPQLFAFLLQLNFWLSTYEVSIDC